MRSKYPYLVDGAVASSAMLVAVLDFDGNELCYCNIIY